jgi:hypothetical protein
MTTTPAFRFYNEATRRSLLRYFIRRGPRFTSLLFPAEHRTGEMLEVQKLARSRNDQGFGASQWAINGIIRA